MKILLTLLLLNGTLELSPISTLTANLLMKVDQLPDPSLTAQFDNRKKVVKVRWKNIHPVSSYVLQRSRDNNTWKDLIQMNGNVLTRNAYISWEDAQTGSGKNYYRLKMYTSKTTYKYSSSIMVIPGGKTHSWIMYPVPVREVVNLQYNGTAPIEGVIAIFIQSITGKTYHRLRLASNTRSIQIPVSNLGRGTYDIRVLVHDEVMWNQRFIK